MTITQAILKIKTEPRLSEHGNSLRGYIAEQYPQYGILHNHNIDDSLLYLYPRVQYRTIKGDGLIIGLAEGVSIVCDIEPLINMLVLRGHEYSIVHKQLDIDNINFGLVDHPIRYFFMKPWIALNNQNYQEYLKITSKLRRQSLLKNILIGNLLSISKSLGYVADKQIRILTMNVEEKETYLKGTPMLGFLGTFSVNFEIPDYWGIGKSVSRGFGTIIRCQ